MCPVCSTDNTSTPRIFFNIQVFTGSEETNVYNMMDTFVRNQFRYIVYIYHLKIESLKQVYLVQRWKSVGNREYWFWILNSTFLTENNEVWNKEQTDEWSTLRGYRSCVQKICENIESSIMLTHVSLEMNHENYVHLGRQHFPLSGSICLSVISKQNSCLKQSWPFQDGYTNPDEAKNLHQRQSNQWQLHLSRNTTKLGEIEIKLSMGVKGCHPQDCGKFNHSNRWLSMTHWSKF